MRSSTVLTTALFLHLLSNGAHSQRATNARAQLATVPLVHGMVITRSVRIRPGVYTLRAPESLDSAIVTIRGENITVDFSGATLRGAAVSAAPEQRRGLGVRIDGGRNVRLLNARVHGYKIGLLARRTSGLSIIDGDFSDNWKPRLFSVIEHESLVDWLSHHHNEKDEWLRFGAGIYLADVHGGELRGNRIEHGMEGLMLTRSDSLRIWNNTIQFNSGVGIGMYRSSDNVIMHNYVSFNVRGFSRYYRRGQDSADLLMYEQSSRNVVAYNSMTHGGDGLFLWAGQSTMDTGEGGSNDNLFFANDFSFAPTNAMEATFSRNAFIDNRAGGSEHGLWGGYSYDSHISGNDFTGNRIGIALEHGQNNTIRQNLFDNDSTGISLWAVPEQPSDWVYPKKRDTRSRDYQITQNRFVRSRVGLRVANTQHLHFFSNDSTRVDSLLVVRDTLSTVIATDSTVTPPLKTTLPEKLPGGLDPARDPLASLPRNTIIVDEWGPYDWRTPKLWPADSTYRTPMPLRVLGPAGTWHVIARRGVTRLSRENGGMNDTIVVSPARGSENDWSITLAHSSGRRFSYTRFQPIRPWRVDFYVWADSARGTHILHADLDRLDLMWYRPTIAGLPQDKFSAVATSTVTLAPGSYTLRTISDDAIRVWIDGKLVIDDWTPHESRVALAPIAAGTHKLRVEYRQVDGWLELRVEIVRGVQTSTGSPAPH